MIQELLPLSVFQLIPKIELHIHLDCSLSYDFVSTYVPNLSYEDFQHLYVGPPKVRDLTHFLTFTHPQISLLQTEQQLRHSVRDVLKQLKLDSIIYSEVRFSPHLHLQKGLTPFEVVQIVTDEAAKWNKKYSIQSNFLLCTLRHYSHKESMETVELVQHFLGKGVVGFDIAGDEAGFSLSEHKEAFKFAHKQSIPITAHAGEAVGPISVWETLSELKPTRIGHGVRSIEDKDLVKKLKDNRIHLEVCPSTNVQINVFPSYLTHPVDLLRKAGVSLGINTDTRTITGVDLSNEYFKLNRAFGWSKGQYFTANEQALQASFCTTEQKKALFQQLEQGFKLIEPF